jgi:hypothetical protein
MLAIPIMCGLALLTAGCGSSGSSSASATAPPATASTTASASAPDAVVCADAAALRTALSQLVHVNVGQGAASQIMTSLNNVRTALTAFISDAHGQYQPQTSALNSALSNLGTSVSNLASNPGASTVAGVVAALGRVGTAGQNLLSAVSAGCPTASPSSS